MCAMEDMRLEKFQGKSLVANKRQLSVDMDDSDKLYGQNIPAPRVHASPFTIDSHHQYHHEDDWRQASPLVSHSYERSCQ